MRLTNLFILITIVAFACNPPKKAEGEQETTETQEVKPTITLTKAPASPQYPDAQLTRVGEGSPVTATSGEETVANQVSYDFSVEGFELGVQTEDAGTRGIANSGKGQHIHFIVNNGPYAAHYMSMINQEMEEGNYTILAFLSRSYHESVKSPGAYFVQNVTVGDVEPAEVDLSAPHLFFSRPKGTYNGADTEKLMLDFYLLNCELSADGFKVRATINDQSFNITEWVPFYIEGLGMGEVNIKLELLDAEGNLVDSPFNPVERTVTLAE
ncbi:MAG: phosphopeptide-binding protein [Cyclobacteriaceae bacterium]